MIIQQPWQQSFIETLQHLYTHENILALVVFGSAAQPEVKIDLWSDVTDKSSPLWRHGQQFGGPIANLP